jgi:hypothetical protein
MRTETNQGLLAHPHDSLWYSKTSHTLQALLMLPKSLPQQFCYKQDIDHQKPINYV